MIEVITAQTGDPVVRWQGLTLSSTRDPWAVSHDWVKSQEADIKGCPSIVVLGLGNGYHVFQLSRKYKDRQIVVIEYNKELIEFCEKRFPLEVAGICIIRADSVDKLRQMARIRTIFKGAFAVLEHGPSCRNQHRFYSDVASFLRGREPESLRQHLELNEKYAQIFEMGTLVSETAQMQGANELISILHLHKWLDPQKGWKGSGLLVRALRELMR